VVVPDHEFLTSSSSSRKIVRVLPCVLDSIVVVRRCPSDAHAAYDTGPLSHGSPSVSLKIANSPVSSRISGSNPNGVGSN
jgi:hypothetical protein